MLVRSPKSCEQIGGADSKLVVVPRTPLLRQLHRNFAANRRFGILPDLALSKRRSQRGRAKADNRHNSVLGSREVERGSPQSSKPRIAIVGGGIAGMTAALELSDHGFPSTVYEASNRIGGRMHSDTTSWANGQVTEHCGELVDSDHLAILGLAQRFNIPYVDLTTGQPANATDTYYFSDAY